MRIGVARTLAAADETCHLRDTTAYFFSNAMRIPCKHRPVFFCRHIVNTVLLSNFYMAENTLGAAGSMHSRLNFIDHQQTDKGYELLPHLILSLSASTIDDASSSCRRPQRLSQAEPERMTRKAIELHRLTDKTNNVELIQELAIDDE